jgi:chaperonin GroES
MAEIKIKPLADRVVVRALTEEESGTKSASGIILPESAKKEQAGEGIVVRVGAGKWDEDGEKRIPMEVKEGDRIVYSKYGFDDVKIADKEYFIVGEANILAVIG